MFQIRIEINSQKFYNINCNYLSLSFQKTEKKFDNWKNVFTDDS